MKKKIGEPRNIDERKERDIADALYERIKSDFNAVNLMVALIACYNAKIYRLRFFLDHLSFPGEDIPEKVPDVYEHPEQFDQDEEEETTDKVRKDEV
jgi:hypothetical protein